MKSSSRGRLRRVHGAAGPLLLGGLAWVSSLQAGDGPLRWRWSNPRPHGNNIIDMAFSDRVGGAVQVAERGRIYSSTDLEQWLPRESGTVRALRGVAFLGDRLVVTGESGTVLYADNLDEFRPGTLIDGPTSDWLEAVAASPSLAVAVGDNGAIYTSADGLSWKRQASGVTDWLSGVAYGGGTFVAVGELGTTLTSTNGTRWAKVGSGTSAQLNRVSFGSGLFTAVGNGGVVRVSANGMNWTGQSMGATRDLYTAAGATTRLVAGDSEGWVFESGTWYDQIGKTNGLPPWIYLSSLRGSNAFLLGGRTGLLAEGQHIGTGTYSWQVKSPSVRSWLFEVAWATNLYVAVGDHATVLTSGNGVDWSLELVPPALTNAIFLGVGGTTNLLVAAGNQGSLMISPYAVTNLVITNETGNVVTQEFSTLGIIWHPVQPRPTTNDLQGVTYHQGQYAVTGDRGVVLLTPDGTNWTQHLAPTTNLLSSVAGFPGGWVATGDDGAIVFSADGANWTRVTSGTTAWLYRVRYLSGQLLTVGQNGVVLTSTNGLDWVLRSSSTTQWLNDITWVDGHYYAAGTLGTLLRSPDGAAWTNLGTITPKSLYGVATDGRQLLLAGLEGVILRSQVVPDLSPVEILSYSRTPGTNTNTFQNLFLFGGHVDQRFTLDYRRAFDTNVWTTGPPLEFYDSSGTLFYLETISGTNLPPTEFYEATLVPE